MIGYWYNGVVLLTISISFKDLTKSQIIRKIVFCKNIDSMKFTIKMPWNITNQTLGIKTTLHHRDLYARLLQLFHQLCLECFLLLKLNPWTMTWYRLQIERLNHNIFSYTSRVANCYQFLNNIYIDYFSLPLNIKMKLLLSL